MTKREICERLVEIRDQSSAGHLGPVGIRDALRDLILDLAAPETEEKPVQEPKSKFPISHPLHMSTEEMKAADAALFTQTGGRMGKDWRNAEEKHPGIIVDPSGKNPPRCLKCNAEALTKRNLFAVGDEWVCCGKCKSMFRVKPEPKEGE